MKSISLKAYAKVNLSLDVTGKLDNGYHTLRSVMQAVNLFDEVTVIDNVEGNDNRIELKLADSNDSSLMNLIPAGNDNLAYKAANAMANKYKADSKVDISITLLKNIPVSAGLAGGSTDAAAVILALAYLWELDDNLDNLVKVGKTVGADVPFCLISNAKNNPECGFADDYLASSTALAEGIGEILTPISSLNGSLIFVKPPISVSTPVVYSLYDERIDLVKNRPNTEILIDAINAKSSGTAPVDAPVYAALGENMSIIKENMVNVLEPIARSEYLEVARILDTLSVLLPNEKVFMSGSGPTVVAFFEHSDEAESKFYEITKEYGKDVKTYSMSLL